MTVAVGVAAGESIRGVELVCGTYWRIEYKGRG
jgi:hypothetical protein